MEKSCSNCGQPLGAGSAHGYCNTCYKRWHRHGDPTIVLVDRSRPVGSPCTECGEPVVARSYCKKHWRAWRRYGDPHFVARPPRPGTCSSCGEPTLGRGAKGYCGKCYQRWKKYGDTSDAVLQYHPKGPTCINCGDPVSPSSAKGYCDRCYKRWQVHGDPNTVLPPSLPPVIRKYSLNHEYFDDISTPEQAYWLGFITADGCVHDGGGAYAVSLALAARDGEHVGRFALALGSDAPSRADRRNHVYVSLNSKRLVKSLERIGVGPRKSATAEPWDGPEYLMPHYWRGLFDGDGCMCRSGGKLYVTIVGSKACVEGFAAWGRPICGSRSKTSPAKPGSPCWKWPVGGRFMATALVRALYEDAPVALERKQKLAESILSA